MRLVHAPSVCIGVNSNSFYTKNKHYLFFDYDDMPLDKIKRDVELIQKELGFDRAQFWFSSFNLIRKEVVSNIWVTVFCEYSLKDMIIAILKSKCDPRFKACAIWNGFTTLRWNPKDLGKRIKLDSEVKYRVKKTKKTDVRALNLFKEQLNRCKRDVIKVDY